MTPKMSVQNSNSKISARPDLATNLLQILIPTAFLTLLCQTGQFTEGLLGIYLVIIPTMSKSKILH